MNHLNKDEKSSVNFVPREFIQSVESKLTSQMVKFTNDYVKGSLAIVLETKNEKRKSQMENSQKSKNLVKSTDVKEITSKISKFDSTVTKKESFDIFQNSLATNNNNIDGVKETQKNYFSNLEESYLTNIPGEENDLKKTNLTKFRLRNKSEDFTKINHRREDLKRLENKHYFDKNNHDRNIMRKSDFMEIVYNYKKKQIKNVKNDLVSKTSHFMYNVVNKSKTNMDFRKNHKIKIPDSTGDLKNKMDNSEHQFGIIQDNEKLINTAREKSVGKNVSSLAFYSTRMSHNFNRTSVAFEKSKNEIKNLKISVVKNQNQNHNQNQNRLPLIKLEPNTKRKI